MVTVKISGDLGPETLCALLAPGQMSPRVTKYKESVRH